MNFGNNFTRNEKLAILCALYGIMYSDGYASDSETNLLSVITIALNCSLSDATEAMQMEPTTSLSILRGMSSDKKEVFSYMMGQMVMADGHFHEKEKEIVGLITHVAQL